MHNQEQSTAIPLAQQHVLGPQIGQPAGARADDGELPALRQGGAVGQHQLHMLAPRAGRVASGQRQRVGGAATGTNSPKPTPIRSMPSISMSSGPLMPIVAARLSTIWVTVPSVSTGRRKVTVG